ncbi:Uncharacterised protein [Vibrio cholerae]|nr:Uncharacterised protein [Vibrio cholerae]
MLTTQLIKCGCGAVIIANRALSGFAINHRDDGWGNTDITRRFLRIRKSKTSGSYIRVDTALCAFHRKVGEIFRGSKPAWEQKCIKFIHIECGYILDFSARNAGRFHQHIACFWHLFTREVVNDMHLLHIRRKAVPTGSLFLDGMQRKHRFVDLCSIEYSTATENNRDFLHDINPP